VIQEALPVGERPRGYRGVIRIDVMLKDLTFEFG